MGVALIHALMMSLFIIDLIQKQKFLILDKQEKETLALANSFSTSSAIWIISDDVSGLQELVNSQRNYPDLCFAIITDENGYILAHTDKNKRGLYLKDIPNQIQPFIYQRSTELTDIIVPAFLEEKHVGWIRIGIKNNALINELSDIKIKGVFYILFTIIIGSFFAWLIGTRITKRLYRIQDTINKYKKGDYKARALINGSDEAASIASEFNKLIDNIGAQHSLLSSVINSSSDIIIFSLDNKYQYTAFNEKHRTEMKKIWNVDIEIGMNLLECMNLEELRNSAKHSMDKAYAGKSFIEVQYQPGPEVYYEIIWNPIFYNKVVVGITAFIRDITKQKANEVQLIKLNRIYSVLSNVNQAIVRIHEPREIMREACRIAVDFGKFQMAWIGIINDNRQKLDIEASWGNSGDYLDKVNIDLTDPYRSGGPAGSAFKTGTYKISNNILLDEKMNPWRNDAIKYGYKSAASFPLIVFNKVIGTFNLYSDEINFFQEEDIKLLDEMAIDISFALEFIENETFNKQAEIALKRSEENYRTLIQKIQVAVIVHGADTKIITCNSKAQEILGLTEEQLLGKTAIEPDWHFYREDSSIMTVEEYPVNRVISSRQELSDYIVGVHRSNNKNDIWALVNANPIIDDDGVLIQVIVTFIDITNRKKTEEELHQSEERFRRLAENARDIIYRMSLPDAKYEYISPAVFLLLGYKPDEYYKNPNLFRDAIHPMWQNYFEKQWINLLKGEMPPTYEYQIIHKSGEVRWFNQRNILIKDSNGKPIAIEGIVTDITNQKHIEDILRINEGRYRMAQAISHTGSWEYNLQTTYFWGSDEAKRIYGFDPNCDTLSTDEVENCIPERELVHQALVDLIENNKPYNLEFKIFPKNSTQPKVITSIAELQVDENGNPLRVIGVIQDITDRRFSEDALRESEWRYREIFNNVLDGLYLLEVTDDGRFRTIEVNPALEKLTGVPRSFSVGKTQEEIVPEEVAEIVNAKYRRCVESGNALEEEVILDLPVGKRYFHSTIIPSRNMYGQIHRIVGISRDITENKETEQKLKLLNFALNNVNDEVYLINKDSCFDYVNEECSRALGYSTNELLQMKVSDIDPDFPFERWLEHWNIIMDRGSSVFETKHKTKNGNLYPVEISANYFEYNGIGYNLALARNISERKKTEEEILKLNQDLEKKVLERTTQLEIANKELEAFAYSVSHDLRAPLRGIDGFSQVLIEEYQNIIDDQGKNYLQRIRTASQRMAQLIDDLLNLSRINRTDMIIRNVNLSEIVQSIIANLIESQPERKVEIIIEKDIYAKGDGRLLRIVLENLIGNSWKFTSNHPSACIEFGMHKQGEMSIYFIRDDGAGFDMNFVNKLFGAFQRLHDSQEFPGTGIGLATVQRIIHRHGGKVWAEGEVEQGATFYFTIP